MKAIDPTQKSFVFYIQKRKNAFVSPQVKSAFLSVTINSANCYSDSEIYIAVWSLKAFALESHAL